MGVASLYLFVEPTDLFMGVTLSLVVPASTGLAAGAVTKESDRLIANIVLTVFISFLLALAFTSGMGIPCLGLVQMPLVFLLVLIGSVFGQLIHNRWIRE